MSVVLLASGGHGPGVTSSAVALAVHSANPVLLVDANREPDQAILAGYLQGIDPGGHGLGGLLQAHRERRPLESALPSLTLPLGEPGHDFLPGFSHPGMVSLFAPVWADFAAALAGQDRLVLVDAGRIGTAGLPAPLVAASAGVLVVTGSRLVDLAALRLYLPAVVAAAGPERVGLLVTGPGRPYGSGEIGSRFDVEVWASLSWQPVEAAVYGSGEPAPRRLASSRYLTQIRALASVVAERAADRSVLVGRPA